MALAVCRNRFALTILCWLLAGCSAGLPQPSPLSSGADLEAVFSATPDYPGYRWTLDGRNVDPEQMGTIAGPAHCHWQRATMLFVQWPLGTFSATSANVRQYIRDRQNVMDHAHLRGSLDVHATLPADARPSGYKFQDIDLYVSPSDQDDAVYLVGRNAVERWPRSEPLTLCA